MPLPVNRVDHVGSLLRPEALKQAHSAFRNGRIDQQQLEAVTSDAISDAIRRQEQVGLPVVTDGEFRRGSWFLGFINAVSGISLAPVDLPFMGDASSEKWQGPAIMGKVKRERPIVLDDFNFLRPRTKRTAKVTLPTPSMMHFFAGRDAIKRKAYAGVEEFLSDLISIYRQEFADLYAAGCRYIQLDEVPLALLCDPRIRERVKLAGDDPEDLVRLYIDAINRLVADRAGDLTVVLHLCRGNYKGHWIGSGGYDPIAEQLFNELAVDGFLLEFDTDRAGSFAPLRLLPETKRAFLGVISSKTDQVEYLDHVIGRLEEAFKHTPAERLGICPQCGFASSAAGNPIATEVQWRKLELAVDVSRRVWGES